MMAEAPLGSPERDEMMASFFNPQSRPDGRLDAAAFHRNHEPIWRVLEPYLRGLTGDVLEAGSGTGQHIVEFARKAASPHLVAERPERGASAQHRGVGR